MFTHNSVFMCGDGQDRTTKRLMQWNSLEPHNLLLISDSNNVEKHTTSPISGYISIRKATLRHADSTVSN